MKWSGDLIEKIPIIFALKLTYIKAMIRLIENFIHHMLIEMGFSLLFARLIYKCISTPTFSILVDGSPYGFIDSSRGLKHGDPLLPYLFSIAMEFLTINLNIEHIKGNFNPIYNIQTMIMHLLYADDILILAKATIENAISIQEVFQRLQQFTGLEINERKSTLFFRKGAKSKQLISDMLNINSGNLPIIYLGIPLSSNKLKARDCGELIDKVNKKHNHWNNKLLIISGQVELVNSVIYPMLHFWLQISQFPGTVIQRINSICANFV